jgi:NADH:ubiquinone oxidoreductase subunit 2 (subunit N)
MFGTIAVPLQAIAWPLLGAAVLLILGRLLPSGIRRLLACAAAIASSLALWSLRSEGIARAEISWMPLNIFRTTPTLTSVGLALPVGIVLAILTLALALGIRGRETQVSWHGLLLISFAGALTMALAANVVTLALGSALLDLALLALAVWGRSDRRDPALSLATPGVASTLVLVFCALRLDAEVGHTSLLVQQAQGQIPDQILVLMGLAGILRLLVFPLHPRRLDGAEKAAAMLLPVAAGVYLLARVQAIAPVLAELRWPVVVGGIALLAGGLLSTAGSLAARAASNSELGRLWTGVLVQQTAGALFFVLLLAGASPWPLLSLTLALAVLVIWWDMAPEPDPAPPPAWLAGVSQTAKSWQAGLARRMGAWPIRQVTALLPGIALASLIGLPFTAGSRARWPLYAALLRGGKPALWLLLIADTFLATGLWLGLRLVVRQAAGRRPAPLSRLAMFLLVALLLIAGIVPGGSLGWKPVAVTGVSVWGLGLLFGLPWLLGGWLASLRVHWQNVADHVLKIAGLDWFYQAAGWIGRQVEGTGFWLSQVGEGEGWWGWALIILTLGAILLSVR